jgi:putative resolvase
MSDEITTSEAAKLLGVTSRTVRNWETKGRISSRRTPGGHRRFQLAEIKSLRKKTNKPVPDGITF